jgi:hypothetical protein
MIGLVLETEHPARRLGPDLESLRATAIIDGRSDLNAAGKVD